MHVSLATIRCGKCTIWYVELVAGEVRIQQSLFQFNDNAYSPQDTEKQARDTADYLATHLGLGIVETVINRDE